MRLQQDHNEESLFVSTDNLFDLYLDAYRDNVFVNEVHVHAMSMQCLMVCQNMMTNMFT